MASLAKDRKPGTWRILFFNAAGQRKQIGLGKCSRRQAESAVHHVEAILAAGRLGTPIAADTVTWLASLSDRMHDKVSNVGLVAARHTATLRAFVDAYIDKRDDVVKSTMDNYKQARRSLLQFFDDDIQIGDVTPEDALDFRRWLESPNGGKLATATASRRCKLAKQFFTAAIRSRIITANPFDGVAMGPQTNREKQHFIDQPTMDKIFDACPNARWRAIFACARYGGLRCPSELATLRWSEILWHEEVFFIHDQKLQRYADKALRKCPLFPLLRVHLAKWWEHAAEGEDMVFPDVTPKTNLATTGKKIVKSAGVTPWPRFWHNLRGSRITELEQDNSIQDISRWMGNSPKIAYDHYLQVTDEAMKRAIENERCAQKRSLDMHVNSSNEPYSTDWTENTDECKSQISSHLQQDTTIHSDLQNADSIDVMPPQGLEPWTR